MGNEQEEAWQAYLAAVKQTPWWRLLERINLRLAAWLSPRKP